MGTSNKNNKDTEKYFNFQKIKSDQSGLVNKKEFMSFLKDTYLIEFINTSLELIYNLDNPKEIDYVELKGYFTCKKRIQDMKVNKLDLILKKLEEHDKRFDRIDERLDNIESCPTIKKELVR